MFKIKYVEKEVYVAGKGISEVQKHIHIFNIEIVR
jgi:hypothetical protein